MHTIVQVRVSHLYEPSTLLSNPGFGVVPTVRAPQLELASRIGDAIDASRGLAAEAGTGVGKTLAYCAQAMEHLLRVEHHEAPDTSDDEDGEGTKRPRSLQPAVVISTFTKALQAQIVERELPRLSAGLVERMRAEGQSEDDIAAALRKVKFAKKVGRGNHLCMRRVEQTAQRFPSEKVHLKLYREFADRVRGWVIDDATEETPLPQDAARYGVGHCSGEKCAYYEDCSERGFLAAKAASDEANILVTNHAMVAADVVLRRRESVSVLPDNVHAFIIDEAHKFPDVLRDALTVKFSANVWASAGRDYTQFLYDLPDSAQSRFPRTLPDIHEVRATCDAFLRDHGAREEAVARAYMNALDNAVSAALRAARVPDVTALRQRAGSASEFTPEGMFVRIIGSYVANLTLHGAALALMLDEEKTRGRYVLATESPKDAGDPPVRVLVPIALQRSWSAYLQETSAVPVYVSATLRTGADEASGFSAFLTEIGGEHAGAPVRTYVTESPFDYAKQAVLYLPPGVDHRMPDREQYARELVAVTRPLLLANEGHAFVLFTSKANLIAYENALGESDYPYPILSQLTSDRVKSRGGTLFKNTPHATLLGTRTFFEGVDIPGLQLSLVIIPQLPVPMETASLAAKRAMYDDDGYTAFMKVNVPLMITDLRQMAGRLIRSVDDRGIVAILDPRARNKAYGRMAVSMLGFPVQREREEAVTGYLSKITERRRAVAQMQEGA